MARVQHVKIFLGVLETDILLRDAGLSTPLRRPG